jgi:biotin transport system substrate-specific component
MCANFYSSSYYPVPFTLQPLAVVLIGAALGSKRGALAVLLYLVEGAAGLPVF